MAGAEPDEVTSGRRKNLLLPVKIHPVKTPGCADEGGMGLADVVFPLKLPPLTYRVPEGLRGALAPGMVVEAEVKKSIRRGVVLGPPLEAPPSTRGLKPISAVVEGAPALSGPMVSLVSWLAEYYFSLEGIALKSMLPREFFHPVKPRGVPKAKAQAQAGGVFDPAEFEIKGAAHEGLCAVRENVRRGGYGAALFHAHTLGQELVFLLGVLEGVSNAIVLAPDLVRAREVYAALEALYGGRVVLYHSGMSRGRRSEAVKAISGGGADIVVGSRSAVFAPMHNVSMIAVLGEESPAYKEDGGVRFNARDVAVKRAYLEGAQVVLSSVFPSVESVHNARLKKYALIDAATGAPWPRVRIIDTRGRTDPITRRLRAAAGTALEKGERVMFVVNREGYSMLRCPDCGYMPTCPKCEVPLMHYRAEGVLRCGYCGGKSGLFDACPSCGGASVGPAGAGVERIREELSSLGRGAGQKTRAALKVLVDDQERLVIGTRPAARRSAGGQGLFSVACVLNADSYLYAPDFRSAERAMRDLVYIASNVKPEGQLILQTRVPGAPLFSHLRRFAFGRFYDDEMKGREAVGFPPMRKAALLTVRAENEPPRPRIKNADAEVLGPVLSVTRRGARVWKIFIKSKNREGLSSALLNVVEGLRGYEVDVDVDPVSI